MAGAPVQQAGFIAFPREKIPAHVVPKTPLPEGLAFNESLKGDPSAAATSSRRWAAGASAVTGSTAIR